GGIIVSRSGDEPRPEVLEKRNKTAPPRGRSGNWRHADLVYPQNICGTHHHVECRLVVNCRGGAHSVRPNGTQSVCGFTASPVRRDNSAGFVVISVRIG